MKNYENLGQFYGGNFAVSAGGNPLTLDAAGIATSSSFLVSELEKLSPKIREPLTSFTYPRDINITVGGGWVDTAAVIDVSYGVTGGSASGVVNAGGANGFPTVQVNTNKGIYKAHQFGVSLRVMYTDMMKTNQLRRPLEKMLTKGVRLTYDKHLDANTYVGIQELGTSGLVNCPAALETTVAKGASNAYDWEHKTAAEILKDVNDAIETVWASCEHADNAMPNHILIPYEQYSLILTKPVSDLATKTILEFLLENNAAVKNGRKMFIGATAYCKGAGTGAADRMVVYVNHEDFVQMEEFVPLTRAMTSPNASIAAFDTSYLANISEAEIVYPNAIAYFDGI